MITPLIIIIFIITTTIKNIITGIHFNNRKDNQNLKHDDEKLK